MSVLVRRDDRVSPSTSASGVDVLLGVAIHGRDGALFFGFVARSFGSWGTERVRRGQSLEVGLGWVIGVVDVVGHGSTLRSEGFEGGDGVVTV